MGFFPITESDLTTKGLRFVPGKERLTGGIWQHCFLKRFVLITKQDFLSKRPSGIFFQGVNQIFSIRRQRFNNSFLEKFPESEVLGQKYLKKCKVSWFQKANCLFSRTTGCIRSFRKLAISFLTCEALFDCDHRVFSFATSGWLARYLKTTF